MAAPVRFGKYMLTHPLAEGGMATVHLAILPGVEGFEKELVVKQIRPDLARDEKFVDLFVSEAKNAVSLQHGNIVPVYELGIVDGTYFIAMERVRGRTLAEVLDSGEPLPPEAAVHVALEVLRALAHAHGRTPPLVHRDVSSRNVMLTWDGEVKVLDFGIAGRSGSGGADAPLGSVGYLAPEQLRGLRADHRSDLFAVGVLLHEMLTGRPHFPRGDTPEMRAEVLSGTSPPPSAWAAHVPAELDAAVLPALERDPEKRPQRAEDLTAPLRKWLAARGGYGDAELARLLAERLGPESREGTSDVGDGGTVPLADPAAVARQVTIATSMALRQAEDSARARADGAAGAPAVAPAPTTQKPAARRRFAAIGLFVGLLLVLAAFGLARDTEEPSTRPTPTRDAAPAPGPRTARAPEPRTAKAATSEPEPRTSRVAPLPRRGRLKLVVLPSGDIAVDGRSYGNSFPAEGVEFPGGRQVLISVTSREGVTAVGYARIPPGGVVGCSVDFTVEGVGSVRCRQ